MSAVGAAVVYEAAARARDYRTLIARGDAALADEQTFAAIEAYSGAILLRPDSMLAHLRRGETYLQRGDLHPAGRDFKRAAELDTSATRPLEQWGDVLYQQRRYRHAAEVYEARLRLDDRSAAVQYRLGLARYREGNLDAAIAALAHAGRLDDRLAEVDYLMGVCLKEKGLAKEAAAALRKAIARAPGMIAAREELADVYGALGRHNEEIQELQMLAGLDPGRIERRVEVGLAHARAGHADLAVLTLANALDQATDAPLVYGALGRVWLSIAETRVDRPDALNKALEALDRAASAPSATSEIKALYGRALLRDHQMEAAEHVLQQATERFPVAPSAFADYAIVAEQQRHFEAARTALLAYSALVSSDDGFVERAMKIGELSLKLSDTASAIQWLERASASAPDDLRPLASLAEAQFRAGNREAARKALARGLELAPANAQFLALSRRIS